MAATTGPQGDDLMTNTPKGTALVTGASGGMGAVYAERLAQRGYDLILVARTADKLNVLAKRLSDETGRGVQVVPADLGDKADLARVEDILRRDASITLLVNNAGQGSAAPLLASDVDRMEAMIALNVIALTRLTYAAVPGFVERGGGTIINISSIAALTPDILNGVYGGSKSFVLTFSRSLQHELADKGVRVQAVVPGVTATDFWPAVGVPVTQYPQQIVMSAADMVDAALAGLDLGESVTLPSLPDIADWNAYDAAREALRANFSRAKPAARYVQAQP
jgi:uncharacterized protein